MTEDTQITAAVLVIGDEILSGRTKDKNIGFIAEFLTDMGIELLEVRVVSDDEDVIVEAVNALRARFTYVFTTGGIGPTHDDITADSMAKAFGVGIDINAEAEALLTEHWKHRKVSPDAMRMARIPFGADLILNAVSGAPGFRLDNVHVMAGVPNIMQSMMHAIAPTLRVGKQIHSRSIDVPFGESTVSDPLRKLQEKYPDVKMGSYPQYGDKGFMTQLVFRSADEPLLEIAHGEAVEFVARVAAEQEAKNKN